METLSKQTDKLPSSTRKKKQRNNIYTTNLINYNLSIPFKFVGKDVADVITKEIKERIEGKCIRDGYIKENSCRVITYTSGIIDGDKIEMNVLLECEVCNPVEDMIIKNCIVQNISKGGIRAQLNTKKKSPFIIFIHRDHEYDNEKFTFVKENDIIKVKVIGTRFELNDPFISIVASLES